jgi:hypothetical protein
MPKIIPAPIVACLFFLTATTVWAVAPTPSPFDHGGAEIGAGYENLTGPFHYPSIYQRERESYGYNPRFHPSTITFDPFNRPYLRLGLYGDQNANGTYDFTGSYRWVDTGYIQTLDQNNDWVVYDIGDIVRSKYASFNGQIRTSIDIDERVVFDGAGGAYTTVTTDQLGDLLLYSPDGLATWEVHSLLQGQIEGRYRIEYTDSHNDRSKPPVIIHENQYGLSLFAPQKNSDGTLTLGSATNVTPTDQNAIIGAQHSGAGNTTATLGDKTYIAYASLTPPTSPGGGTIAGTAQYIVTYDHNTGQVSTPLQLGITGHPTDPPDEHNIPAIAADSQGYLHVILGAHVNPLEYVRSDAPNDASSFTAIDEFGGPHPEGNTYVSFTIDPQDNLHVFSRGGARAVDEDGDGENNRWPLEYHRRSPGASTWAESYPVLAGHIGDSWWYQKSMQDSHGRLFVSYYYYAAQLNAQEAIAHITKWPDEQVINGTPTGNAHDPVVIMSTDGGSSWTLALTDDFVSGMNAELAQSWTSNITGDWTAFGNWAPFGAPDKIDAEALLGDVISTTQTVFTNTAVTVGSLRIDSPHTYVVGGPGSVNLESSTGGASLQVDQGNQEFQIVLNLASNATFNIAMSASLEMNHAVHLQGHSLTKTGSGNLAINNLITTDGGTLVIQDGSVTGNSIVTGAVVNTSGILSPGSSPGTWEIAEDYVQESAATLLMEIGGQVPGVDHDLLRIHGNASLDGLLDVRLLDGFAPNPGDQFQLLDIENSTGQFADVELPTLLASLRWDLSDLYTHGTLSVVSVPEPSTQIMIALILLQPLFRSRWHRKDAVNRTLD